MPALFQASFWPAGGVRVRVSAREGQGGKTDTDTNTDTEQPGGRNETEATNNLMSPQTPS